ncbi:MAG TPA: response regulator [Ktedonobacteraceae bacterium]|nr:response regulator [Ktedonobacteraceae bacterium]
MPTILCIDDVLQGLFLRQSLLESHGYEVLTASDGLSGIQMARNHPVDAVLLDYDMPGMMGDEVAGALKREHPSLPVIILTGFLPSIPEMLLRIADGCVQKGGGHSALLRAIERALKQRPKPSNLPKDDSKAG